MRLASLAWFCGTLGLAAAAWTNVSWLAGTLVLVWALSSLLVGTAAAWWDVRTDGYVMEKRPDPESGKGRWWIGAVERDGKVRWLMPGRRSA